MYIYIPISLYPNLISMDCLVSVLLFKYRISIYSYLNVWHHSVPLISFNLIAYLLSPCAVIYCTVTPAKHLSIEGPLVVQCIHYKYDELGTTYHVPNAP